MIEALSSTWRCVAVSSSSREAMSARIEPGSAPVSVASEAAASRASSIRNNGLPPLRLEMLSTTRLGQDLARRTADQRGRVGGSSASSDRCIVIAGSIGGGQSIEP